MCDKFKSIGASAVKTFFSTALAYFIPALAGVRFLANSHIKNTIIGILLSAVAAGFAGVYEGLIKPKIENSLSGDVYENTQADNYITENENGGGGK